MTRDTNRHTLAQAALAATAFAITALVVLRPRFETNDDVMMMWIADGTLFGTPTADLVFTNVLIGGLLARLYTAWASVSWYSLYLVALLWVALVAQLFVLMVRRPTAPRAWLVYGTVLTINLLAWLHLQFTSTAGLLGVSGVALLCFTPRDVRYRREMAIGVAAAAMVGVCSLVRFESLLLTIAVTAPIVMASVVRLDPRRIATFGLIVAVIAGGGMVAQASAQSSEDWAAFKEWTVARGLLHDTPRLDDPAAEAALLDEVGWTVNDATLFKEWLILDRETFDLTSVDRIGRGTEPDQSPIRIIRRIGGSALAVWPAVLAVGLITAMCLVDGDRRGRTLCIATAIVTGAVLSWLVLTAKIPMRVVLPMFTWYAVSTAALLGDRWIERGTAVGERGLHRAAPLLGGAAIALVAATVGTSLLLWGPNADRQADQAAKALLELDRHDPDGIFVMWGGPIQHEFAHPFDRSSDPDLQFVFSGWLDRSPMQTELVDRLELGRTSAAIAQRSDVHLVLTNLIDEPEELFITHLAEKDISGDVRLTVDEPAVRVLGCADRCVR